MTYDQYYDYLKWKEVDLYDRWIIVMIEAAWYCESRHGNRIRYSELKKRSDEKLNEVTDGKHSEFGGQAFLLIINKYSNSSTPKKDRYLTRVKVKGKNVTWIYPNIPLIREEVKRRQAESLKARNKRLRTIDNNDMVHHPRFIFEPPLVISESLARQTSKTRGPGDPVPISEGLGMKVMHTDPKEE